MLTHIGTREIETERLILRRVRPEDAETVFRNWASDPMVTRFLRWQAHASVEETRAMVARWVGAYESDEKYLWGVEVRGGELIGAIACGTDGRDDRGEVGYNLGQAYWNKGYMTEALRAVIDYMIDRVGLNRVEAHHATRNPASGRVMAKAGMWYEGRPRQQYRSTEGYEDCCLYGITREIRDAQREMAYYNSLPLSFTDFVVPGALTDGEISLVLAKTSPAVPERKRVPAYEFDIVKDGARAGHIGLRIGYTDGLYYGGQIGYGVDEEFRGRGYAGRACALLRPVMRAHGMRVALITNNVDNLASRRVCEKLGARLLRRAELPEEHELYRDGERYVNIYEWTVD